MSSDVEAGEDATPEELGGLAEEVSSTLRERYAEQEPSPGAKAQMLAQHDGHLVRSTFSTLSVDADLGIKGIEAHSEVDLQDVYCFDCECWVGLCGVHLRGTPRSKTDAYFLGGVPDDVEDGWDVVRATVCDLAEHVYAEVDRVDSADAAFAFIADEIDQIREEVADGE